jgi:para-aminobenzoate synthetase/4-amino-4-deoxychorismate lyase
MSAPHAVIEFSAGHADLHPLHLAFGAPCRELFAWTGAEVLAVLAEVDALARRGLWCVGYLRYEAARAFEPAAAVHDADGPLAYFSVHRERVDPPRYTGEPSVPLAWNGGTTRARFDASVASIHAAIARGEVYQVNHTCAMRAGYEGDPFDLYCALRRAQPGANAAYLVNGHEAVLSVSPELFFDWDGETLQCRPMKGTAARGATPALDRAQAEHLRTSAKERAENVMIVDLLRNDMSRVAELGSVQVARLFECEPWPTVWQMTSTVVARTRPQIRLLDLFQALFPCGSVVGAPKLRAMHWIRELEPGARGIYCGAVGVVQPGGLARFNVPIRTVSVRQGVATCGIGSGITADSTTGGEWDEWTHKMQFLEQASRPFRLLQTLRLESGGANHLEQHIDRLAAAGAHFGFPVDRAAVRHAVRQAEGDRPSASARARVTVDARGAVEVAVCGLPAAPAGPLPVVLAPQAVSAPAAFLRHKTTRREHLEGFAVDTPAAFDTLLWNGRGEVTEFTRGNVIVERMNGEQVTPPLHCGLLDGVGRACELLAGRVREDVVPVDELHRARRIWFVNALRGRVPVYLHAPAG